ncbi:MAG: hypothetical protein Q9204_002801 [Flavoplaca sp. TL-2023a]
MARIERHPRIVWVRNLLSQFESPLLKELPNYGQFPPALSKAQCNKIKLQNGASGGNLRESCDINLKELRGFAFSIAKFERAAMGLQLLIGRRLKEIQDTTGSGPSNKFADAMKNFAGVLKEIATEADGFKGELREFYLELGDRGMARQVTRSCSANAKVRASPQLMLALMGMQPWYNCMQMNTDQRKAKDGRLELLSIPVGVNGKWLSRADRADLRYLQHQIRHLPIIKLYFSFEDRLLAFQDMLTSSRLHADHQDATKRFAQNLEGALPKLDGVVNDLFDTRELPHGRRKIANTRRPRSRPDNPDAVTSPSPPPIEHEDDL